MEEKFMRELGIGMSANDDMEILNVVERHIIPIKALQLKAVMMLKSIDDEDVNRLIDEYLELRSRLGNVEPLIQALEAMQRTIDKQIMTMERV